MGESKLVSQEGINDLSRTIGEYRAIVDELMQKEKDKIRQVYDREANGIISGAWQKAEEIIASSQKEAQSTRERAENQARKEAVEIVAAARSKAQSILNDAEARDKKEARSRTKAEVDRIISAAKEEASGLVNKARDEYNGIIGNGRKQAEKDAGEIIGKVKEEAQKLIREEMDKCRVDAQAQLARDVAEAQKKTKAVIDEIIAGGNGVGESILKIMQQGDGIVDKFKSDLQGQLGELSRAIAIARKKTETATPEAVEARIAVPAPEVTNRKVALSVRFKGERPPGNHLFKGQMELKTMDSDDYKHIRRMRDFLVQIPNIRFAGEVSSEEETAFTFEIREFLPVMDILGNMPSVDKLEKDIDGYRLVLK